MKKLFLTLLLSVSSNAVADWVYVGNNEYKIGDEYVVHTAYGDPASIQRVGNIAKLRIFIDKRRVKKIKYKKNELPKLQASVVGWQAEFECKKALSRSFSSEWAPVSPDSIDEGLWKLACGK